MPALTFFKCSPGGNTTVLLVDTGLSPAQHEHVASILLSPLHLHAEQVGFITLHKPSLRMAGGEFCVNAARSLGALLALQGLLSPNENGILCATVPVSGLDGPVQLEVQAMPHGSQRTLDSALIVPLSLLAGENLYTQLDEGIVLVRLPGICHVLLDAARHPVSGHWQEEAAAVRARYHLEEECAVGCIWWQKNCDSTGLPALSMKPVVWVRGLNSTCLENSCGSGAMACALMLHWQEQQGQNGAQHGHEPTLSVSYSLMQPSGSALKVSLLCHKDGNYARISGPVTVLAEGTVYLDSLNPQ